MARVLIVSPRFPPASAADMHRVRLSVAHFPRFGWEPHVLTVEPRYLECGVDPLLLETLPAELAVYRVRALRAAWTRRLGVGDLGLRALPFLYRAGTALIRRLGVDLVYISTTAFTTMVLGRLWKTRLGVPFVLDMQDPWVHPAWHAASRRGVKHDLMRWLHRRLEPRTMQEVDGLVAVSADCLRSLQSRYPRLGAVPSRVLPFGADARDFALLRARRRENRVFRPGDGAVHGVYAGIAGADMHAALDILLAALARGRREAPQAFARVRLHFVGTDYAAGRRARDHVTPLARRHGVAGCVSVQPSRLPYFDALQLLLDADFLLLPGSAEAQYMPSKLFPCLLAGRPLLGLFHAHGPVFEAVRGAPGVRLLPFVPGAAREAAVSQVLAAWHELLTELPRAPRPPAPGPSGALEMARAQCALFDAVRSAGRSA